MFDSCGLVGLYLPGFTPPPTVAVQTQQRFARLHGEPDRGLDSSRGRSWEERGDRRLNTVRIIGRNVSSASCTQDRGFSFMLRPLSAGEKPFAYPGVVFACVDAFSTTCTIPDSLTRRNAYRLI
jgi:hypothetical protein